MKNSTMFLIIGMAAAFAMILAPTLNAAPVYAISSNWDGPNCSGPGTKDGPCPGGSINSPNREESYTNKGGNTPKGHIDEGRK